MKVKYKTTGLSIPETTLKTLDQIRGDIPRSTYIVRILDKALLKAQKKENGITAI